MYFTKQRINILAVFTLICIFVIYVFYDITRHSDMVEIEPSYVLAVKGNDQPPLYAQVRGLVIPNEPCVKLTKKSIKQSKDFTWKNHTIKTSELLNYANVHIWNEICGKSIQNLLFYPLFPHLPTSRASLNTLEVHRVDINTGMRIFGYIVPTVTSDYQFHLSALGIDIQVWFSNSYEPKESKLVLSGTSQRDKMLLVSSDFFLKHNQKYYFDIILKTFDNYGKFYLKWKSNHLNTIESITKDSLHPFTYDAHYPKNQVIIDYLPPLDVPMLLKRNKLTQLHNSINRKRNRIYLLPFIDEKDVEDLFPQCKYHPSYISKIKYQFQGVWEMHFTSIFPADNTDIPYKLITSLHDHTIFGNPVLDEDHANDIANKVLNALIRRHDSKYSLVSILNIEQNHDPIHGNRYLVELELANKHSSTNVRYSEYIYQRINTEVLCYPENFKWNKNADVNVILTVGNQGRWAKHFINTLSRIYNDTKDPYLNVIIVDFDSKDIDIVHALQKSSFPRYTLLKRAGKFHKTEAIQAAVNTVNDPNAITLQLDLHLVIPSDIIDHVRKHTVKGKMTFSPILARLQCGANPHVPHGFWEISGYGIFGIYKSDWDLIGGMAVKKFREKWGDEDWDLLDRVINTGFEVERIKIPNFYHVFHTKKGMWQNMV